MTDYLGNVNKPRDSSLLRPQLIQIHGPVDKDDDDDEKDIFYSFIYQSRPSGENRSTRLCPRSAILIHVDLYYTSGRVILW